MLVCKRLKSPQFPRCRRRFWSGCRQRRRSATAPRTEYLEASANEQPLCGTRDAQTTGGWWTWTTDGQSRLDLFSVTGDQSGIMQYTAMDPGPSKSYTWSYNLLGNPAVFTDGALTWCTGHLYRMDIFGVRATGQATQLYYQWPERVGKRVRIWAHHFQLAQPSFRALARAGVGMSSVLMRTASSSTFIGTLAMDGPNANLTCR